MDAPRSSSSDSLRGVVKILEEALRVVNTDDQLGLDDPDSSSSKSQQPCGSKRDYTGNGPSDFAEPPRK